VITNISDKQTASIFYPKPGGGTFLQNESKHILGYVTMCSSFHNGVDTGNCILSFFKGKDLLNIQE